MSSESIDWPYGPGTRPTSAPGTATTGGHIWPGTTTNGPANNGGVGDLLARTQRFAEEATAKAEREAHSIVASARQSAAEVVDQAHQQAAQIRLESQHEADRLLAQADGDRRQAEQLLLKAQIAQQESEQLRIDAEQARAHAEAAQRAAEGQIQRLAVSRESVDQLSTAIGSFADTNHAIVDELVRLRDALLEPEADQLRQNGFPTL